LRADAQRDAGGAVTRLRPEGIATTRVDIALSSALYASFELGAVVDPLRTRVALASADGGEPYRASLLSFRGTLSVQIRFW
jgi:hypothetical protein